MIKRPSWDHYFMDMAVVASQRGTCNRAKVGAILVMENAVIATGYNGSLPGMPHCLDVGCDMLDGHCVATVHAEMNALIQAARLGRSTVGATLYATVSPCWGCFRLLVAAGVKRFVCLKRYWHRDNVERVNQVLSKSPGIAFECWQEEGRPESSAPAPGPSEKLAADLRASLPGTPKL